MKCIKVLTDNDFFIKQKEFDNPKIRYGARGLVFNDEKKIAILHKSKKNEYKLVGGGIEENEVPIDAFIREVLEEAGVKIKVKDFLGIIREEKSQDNFIQISYVYVSNVVSNTNQLHLTLKEIGEGSELLWLSIDEAMNLIKNSEGNLIKSGYDGEMSIYHTKFIVRRDYEILKFYIENYK